jgi:hypothetical protein
MRYVLRAMCAVALAGCSDVKNPVESLNPYTAAAGHPEGPTPKVTIDPRPIADRIDALFGDHLGKVTIPADAFSLASDAVHPDMACPPNAWNGAKCWLMYTPYRNSDPSYENPAVLFATTDTTWSTPTEVRNPIIPYPGAGYNSDPDQAFDPVTQRMVQMYRVVADSFNKIMIMSTANAKQWTTPTVAFKESNHDAVSPALIIGAGRLARLWYVRTGTQGCTATTSTVVMRSATPDGDSRYEKAVWSAATPTTMSIPKYVVWHLDVIEMPGDFKYLALIAAYPRGSNCANSDLWLASSVDGINWDTYAMPILWRTMNIAKQRSISTWYRGTMRYDAATDLLDVWPSAMSRTNWYVYHAAVKLSDVLGLLHAVPPGSYQPSFQVTNPVPLRMP